MMRVPRRTPLLALALAVAACGGNEAASDIAETTPSSTVATTVAPATTKPAPVTTSVPSPPPQPDICAYRDMGMWVDVYDTVPAFVGEQDPPVTPADIATMHANGVRTLYLQVAKDDPRSPQVITDETSAAGFLREAHAVGMRVVAWYLPTHRDHALDLQRVKALVEFEADGEHFDGIGVDIEGTEAVADVGERNRRLLDLMKELDNAAGMMPIAAIVYPPVVFDVLNDRLWPNFPWTEIAPYVDLWMPMAYWTYRDSTSPYRDAYLYTSENIERVRDHVGDPNLPVHVIGGIGDKATDADYEAFRRAAADQHAIGFSVYDYDTLSTSAWPLLAADPTC